MQSSKNLSGPLNLYPLRMPFAVISGFALINLSIFLTSLGLKAPLIIAVINGVL